MRMAKPSKNRRNSRQHRTPRRRLGVNFTYKQTIEMNNETYTKADNMIDLQDLVSTMEEMEWRMDHGQKDKYEPLYKRIGQAIDELNTAINAANELLNNEEIQMDENELYY